MCLNKQPWTLTTLRIGPPILLSSPPQKRRTKTLSGKHTSTSYNVITSYIQAYTGAETGQEQEQNMF